MNIYTHEFSVACPNNGDQIAYTLYIATVGRMIFAEHIIAATEMIKEGLHEKIADELFERFGGIQVLTANHGLGILTIRGLA
jgi:hypothetical protein